MDREQEDNVLAVVFKTLEEMPLRHKRERIYLLLDKKFSAGVVATIRARFNDEGTTMTVACACGQRNRVNLRSTHERDVGPRCGRCKKTLPE